MTRIREERARVGEHTHESAQQSQYREGVHLTDHTIHLIIEPPARTKLDLSGLSTLEVTQHRGNHLVGAGVQCI